MKKDDWTKLIIPITLTWIIAIIIVLLRVVSNIMNNTAYSLIVLFGVPVILIVFWLLARRYFSEPDIDLEFYSYFEPKGHTVNLDRGDKFQLVWTFKNNQNNEIKILSYNIRINLNGKFFQDHNWRDNYTPTIPPRVPEPILKMWGEKGKGGYNINEPGEYEFQSIVEYQLSKDEKKLTQHTSPLTIVGNE